MEDGPYPISLRVKMIRETEEFLKAHLPAPAQCNNPPMSAENTPDVSEPVNDGRRDLDPAA